MDTKKSTEIQPKKTLRDIMSDAMALEALLLESGGELSEDIESWMQEIQNELTKKATSYQFVMDRLDATETLMKNQAAQYTALARGCANAKGRMRERIRVAMETMGVDKIGDQETEFRLQRSAPVLDIDELRLPEAYKMVIQNIVPDKEKIKEDLKSGKTVDGARFLETRVLRNYKKRSE